MLCKFCENAQFPKFPDQKIRWNFVILYRNNSIQESYRTEMKQSADTNIYYCKNHSLKIFWDLAEEKYYPVNYFWCHGNMILFRNVKHFVGITKCCLMVPKSMFQLQSQSWSSRSLILLWLRFLSMFKIVTNKSYRSDL